MGLLSIVSPVSSSSHETFTKSAVYTNESLYETCESVTERYGPFDLLHTHDWLTSFAAIRYKHAHKMPLLATVHATERGRGRGSLGTPWLMR